jgi:hypothetical protein
MKAGQAAAAVALLLLFPSGALALQWEGERTVADTVAVPAGQALAVAAGTNVTFDVPPAGSNGTRPIVDVSGTLEVSGTAERPVTFRADSAVYTRFRAPAALRLDRASFSVRNATFIEMVVEAVNSSGRFEDCLFIDCDIIVKSSPAVFRNCSFVWASNLNITGGTGGPEVQVFGCRFDGSQGWRICEWRWDTYSSAVELNGPAVFEGTNITSYGYGLRLGSGRARLSGCNLSYCYIGMDLGPGGPAEIAGTTVENCLYAGVRSRGDLAMRCNLVTGCRYGLVLDGPAGAAPSRTFSENLLFGNGGFGIAFTGPPIDTGDTLFESGGIRNAGGRVIRFVRLTVNVVDPAGKALGFFALNLTDRFGNPDNRSHRSPAELTLPEHFIDGNGSRQELFPYTLEASRGGSANRTVLGAPVDSVTLVLPAPPAKAVPAEALAAHRLPATWPVLLAGVLPGLSLAAAVLVRRQREGGARPVVREQKY